MIKTTSNDVRAQVGLALSTNLRAGIRLPRVGNETEPNFDDQYKGWRKVTLPTFSYQYPKQKPIK